MQEKVVLRALAALSQVNRLRVFRALVVAGQAGATPGVIGKRLKVSPAQERSGRNLVYRADYAAMTGLLAYMTENCCQGAACDASSASTGKC